MAVIFVASTGLKFLITVVDNGGEKINVVLFYIINYQGINTNDIHLNLTLTYKFSSIVVFAIECVSYHEDALTIVCFIKILIIIDALKYHQ